MANHMMAKAPKGLKFAARNKTGAYAIRSANGTHEVWWRDRSGTTPRCLAWFESMSQAEAMVRGNVAKAAGVALVTVAV